LILLRPFGTVGDGSDPHEFRACLSASSEATRKHPAASTDDAPGILVDAREEVTHWNAANEFQGRGGLQVRRPLEPLVAGELPTVATSEKESDLILRETEALPFRAQIIG